MIGSLSARLVMRAAAAAAPQLTKVDIFRSLNRSSELEAAVSAVPAYGSRKIID